MTRFDRVVVLCLSQEAASARRALKLRLAQACCPSQHQDQHMHMLGPLVACYALHLFWNRLQNANIM